VSKRVTQELTCFAIGVTALFEQLKRPSHIAARATSTLLREAVKVSSTQPDTGIDAMAKSIDTTECLRQVQGRGLVFARTKEVARGERLCVETVACVSATRALSEGQCRRRLPVFERVLSSTRAGMSMTGLTAQLTSHAIIVEAALMCVDVEGGAKTEGDERCSEPGHKLGPPRVMMVDQA